MNELFAEFEQYLTGSPFFDELLAGIESTAPATTPEEAFQEVLANAEASLVAVDTPLEAELWGSEMMSILGLPGLPESVVEGFIADSIVPMAARCSMLLASVQVRELRGSLSPLAELWIGPF